MLFKNTSVFYLKKYVLLYFFNKVSDYLPCFTEAAIFNGFNSRSTDRLVLIFCRRYSAQGDFTIAWKIDGA